LISIQNIHKSFGTQKVINGIDLEIKDGMITSIVGPSGVGKSVTLKLILGIYEVDSGQILINKQSITNCKTEEERNKIREKLGVLFQSAALFDSLTIYDNVKFNLINRKTVPKSEIHEKVIDILKKLSLIKFMNKFPEEVSIGIRKRAGMARALITEPNILLFDEPNTGLDPIVGQEVYDLIKECHKEWKFAGVVISHELPEVFQVSDNVAMIYGGKIIYQGTPQQMINEQEDKRVKQFLNGEIDGPIKIN